VKNTWTVVDLFSGAGGMSYGFHAHPKFRIAGAVDAQIGKPSSGKGSLECNDSYEANMGVKPFALDLSEADPDELAASMLASIGKQGLTVLCSCAPCTGFSRTMNQNHLRDDPRNSLVGRSALFVRAFQPQIFLMENARELIKGNFGHHFSNLAKELETLGYEVHGSVHMLNRFGLPQQRERSLVVAVKDGLPLRTIDDLWDDLSIKPAATHVRRAISSLPVLVAGEVDLNDPMHTCPKMGEQNMLRLQSIPANGGSWADLRHNDNIEEILTPAMLRSVAKSDFGSHPDVYGRMSWDRPAPTIKRECGHIGNGRYAHPEQDRLCSIREMAILQGFPDDYKFCGKSLSNRYRHIGDAVPPLISFQLAAVCEWILTDEKPEKSDLILPNTHLKQFDIVSAKSKSRLFVS